MQYELMQAKLSEKWHMKGYSEDKGYWVQRLV